MDHTRNRHSGYVNSYKHTVAANGEQSTDRRGRVYATRTIINKHNKPARQTVRIR